MSEEELRELERQAASGDPQARIAFVRALARARDPRVLEIEILQDMLRERLDELRQEILRCPQLRIDDLGVALDQALIVRPHFDPELGFGSRVLGRASPPRGRAAAYVAFAGFGAEEGGGNPQTVYAFAVRQGYGVRLRIATTDSAKPSVGSAFPVLRPWNPRLKPKTLEAKCRRWWDVEGYHQITLAEAELWVDLQGLDPEGTGDPELVIEPDPPSEKQLAFIGSLREQKGLGEKLFVELLLKHGRVERLELLRRRHASPLIEALLALSNKPKVAKKPKKAGGKLTWSGSVRSVQPRIRLSLVGGEEQHGYQGYVLSLEGTLGEEERAFTVGIGKAAQAKHGFQVGDQVSGAAAPVVDPKREPMELYKASKLKLEGRDPPLDGQPPPWRGTAPPLPDYRKRGHRPLTAETYAGDCAVCFWGCRMPVEEMARRGDAATFTIQPMCYGPKDCFFYEAP